MEKRIEQLTDRLDRLEMQVNHNDDDSYDDDSSEETVRQFNPRIHESKKKADGSESTK